VRLPAGAAEMRGGPARGTFSAARRGGEDELPTALRAEGHHRLEGGRRRAATAGAGGSAPSPAGGAEGCSGFCPHSQRGITPSENPAHDAERYASVTTRTPGSPGAKRTRTTEVTQTQR